MPLCCVVAADLLTWSQLRAAACTAGFETVQVRRREDLAGAQQATAVIVHLTDRAGGVGAVRAARAAMPEARIIAIGPHVRTDLMRAANEAGADLVMPDSAVATRLAGALSRPDA